MATAPQQNAYQALYRACMKEAAAQGRTLMQRLVVRAGDTMPRRAAMAPDEHERKLLTDAVRTLMKHEVALCEAYPQALLSEFALAIAGDTRKAGALSFDSLELMGDDQMQESVEVMRLQQSVASQVEAELTDLNALICAVQGLKSVQAERNPLRPEVYVRSLRTVALQSPVPTLVRTRWMQNLGEALGPELARVYRELAGMLRAQGVVEARFLAVPTPEIAAAVPAGATGSPQATAQTSALLNVRELRRLLSGEFDPEGGATPGAVVEPPEFSVTVPAAFETLQEMKQVDKVMERLKQRQAADPARLEARGAGQALGQEVVKLMVENIATDARLLTPVQQTVRDLEPALLRLAVADPRFFSDRKHPARRLLDQLTQRSLAWESIDVPGFAAFLEPLQQAVDVLLSTHMAGAEPFDFALKTLEDAWGDQHRRDRSQREKAVRTLLQAEQRHLLAEKIARETRSMAESSGTPREIGAFLAGPWSQVLAQARLADATGSSDPGGYAGMIADLLWSAQPHLAGASVPKLIKMIPGLVQKLRDGLATIDYPGPSTKRFLDLLADMHRQAMVTSDTAARAAAPITRTREELEAMFSNDDDDAAGPWLGPREAQDSGFMETQHSISPQPVFQDTQPASFSQTRPPRDELSPDLSQTRLQPGVWVEMLMDGGWGRYQVTWASPHGTLFMFVNAAGSSHSMTRRLLGNMLSTGTLRMISARAVVDGALDAVAQTALRNSLDIKL